MHNNRNVGKHDTVAEWLRRWIANPLLFERVSSNLTGVDILFVARIESFLDATKCLRNGLT